jgi:ribosomal protein S14
MPKLSAENRCRMCGKGRAYFVATALRIFLIRLRTVSLGFAPWPIQ